MNYIWDLDGTLLDSYGAIVSSLAEESAAYGLRIAEGDILHAVKQQSVSAYLQDLSRMSGAPVEALRARYREISHAKTDEITLIAGAVETLAALKAQGCRHFVYTHRGKSSFPLLRRLGIEGFFTEIVTSANGFPPKPAGDGITYLLRAYFLSPADTAYVGDRTLDVDCAKNAGVTAVLYLPPDSCVVPTGREDRIIRDLRELCAAGSE